MPHGATVTWTPELLGRLTDLLELGWDDARIARALGATTSSVLFARRRRGIPPARRQAHTTVSVGRIVGCSKDRVLRWIREGHLPSYAGPETGRGPMRLVRYSDLLAFLEAPHHWHRWDPERMSPHCGLQWWARELRQGVRFLTIAEIAERYCVQYRTVLDWIEHGELPVVRDAHRVFAREDTLASFKPPGQRPRFGQFTKRDWSSADDETLLAMRANGARFPAIARALRRSPGAVEMRLARLDGRVPLVRTHRYGGREGRGSKLTADQVRELRATYAAGGVTYEDLGRRYGVHSSAIGQIVRRERWTRLGDAND